MLSMFTVTGQVLGTFTRLGQVNKETGEVTPPTKKVQLQGVMPVPGGDTRYEMIDLTIENESDYKPLMGKQVRVPLGFFAPQKGNIVYFIPKGSKPEVVANA